MIEIIPAIDIIDGKCVRLTQGDFLKKKVYNEDPLSVAKTFEQAGLRRLHLVDLDGAKQGHIVNIDMLEKICTNTSLTVDFGGGIKTDEDVRTAFSAGAAMITAGSIAVKNKNLVAKWFAKWGAEKIILGADVSDKTIATHGWQENSGINIYEFYESFFLTNFKYSICTDISKDGMLKGPSIELYKEILDKFPEMRLIASGGVSSLEDIRKLEAIGVYGVIIGKAIYENKINIRDLV